jgi:hypothetical protein
MRVPIHTCPDAPCFRGSADELPHYIAAVEDLCHSRPWTADANFIKYAAHYTDKKSWDAFAAVRDMLDDPKTWDGFKTAIGDMYPHFEETHEPAPLPAPTPPVAAPSAAPPPIAHLVPLLPSAPLLSPAAAIMLSPDAPQACAPQLPVPPAIASFQPSAKPIPVPQTPPITAQPKSPVPSQPSATVPSCLCQVAVLPCPT